MHIIDDIAYANGAEIPLSVISVRAMDGYKLWLRFSTGETKVFDFTPLLDNGAFRTLKNKELFEGVYIDFGVPVWCDGEIDIAPERLYYEGISENE